MKPPTKTGAVVRDEKGRVTAGTAALNPGGLTVDERAARDWMRTRLVEDRELVHAALIAGVQEGNPVLVKYAHEQLHGKAKELLDIEGGGASLLVTLLGHYRALPESEQAVIEAELERKAR